MQNNPNASPPAGHLSFSLLMAGVSAKQEYVPKGLYRFVSVHNPTPNTITIYEGLVAAPYSGAKKVGVVTPNTAITFPITMAPNFTFAWLDGGGATTKEASITFSAENLNINTQLGSASASTVTLAADSVGLARGSQLPATLDGNGNLKVSQQPSLSIGTVKITAGAAGTQTVKASAGTVFAIRAVGAVVTLRDNTTDKWENAAGTGDVFQHPISCGTSIILNFSAAGTAYVQYQ